MLKTLKDFEVNPKSWAGAMANAGRKYTIDIDELKQEAIKWIHVLIIGHASRLDEIPTEHTEDIIKWIKHFFNIKEEELNDNNNS